MTFGDSVDYRRARTREFGSVLVRLLKSKRFYQKSKYGAIARAWAEVVGEEVCSCTKIGSFRHGKLRVGVGSSILLQELSGFRKESLLSQLQQRKGAEDVVELHFFLDDGFEEGE